MTDILKDVRECVQRHKAMTPPTDYAEPVDTRAARRHRLFIAFLIAAFTPLAALSIYDFAASVLEHFERMEQHERAAQLGRAQR